MPKKYFKLWFSKLICQSIIKVWSTFSKVVGVGKAHKYFPFMQSKDSQTACCLRLINCYIGRFYGRCPNPQFLKKLSKLFCFWEDNLALAKFQSPTDTPLNHNLSQLLIKNLLPNFFCNFLYKCEFSPLLFFGEFVADFA